MRIKNHGECGINNAKLISKNPTNQPPEIDEKVSVSAPHTGGINNQIGSISVSIITWPKILYLLLSEIAVKMHMPQPWTTMV